MAASILEYDTTTDVASFACDDVADLDLLPTTTKWGVGESLKNIDEVKMGSTAIVINTGDVYMLTSEDVWKKL